MKDLFSGILLLALSLPFLSWQAAIHTSSHPSDVSIQSPLWRLDKGFNSRIRVQAGPAVASVTVWPVLFFPNGWELPLEPIDLSHGGVAEIDIREALTRTHGGWAQRFLRGSAALYHTGPDGAITASVLIEDDERSLVFTNSFTGVQLAGQPRWQRMESLWWRRTPQTTMFLAISNPGEDHRAVEVLLSDEYGVPLLREQRRLGPHSMLILDAGLNSAIQGRRQRRGGLEVRFWAVPAKS